MTRIQYLAYLWTLVIITQTGCVCGDIQFLERHEGESVVLPCVVDQRNPSPFAMYLKRRWLQPGEVLYMHTETELHVKNNDYISRAIASGDPSSHSLNVTISQLRASDTDRYYCEFYVGDNLGLDKPLPESTEFFLLVNAGTQCSCPSYSTLLYALSSAVAILVFLLGFVLIYQGKSRRRVKAHHQAPIYEDMAGVQLASQKLASRHLEEMEPSEYRNCPVKKSCPENHYESPLGPFTPGRSLRDQIFDLLTSIMN